MLEHDEGSPPCYRRLLADVLAGNQSSKHPLIGPITRLVLGMIVVVSVSSRSLGDVSYTVVRGLFIEVVRLASVSFFAKVVIPITIITNVMTSTPGSDTTATFSLQPQDWVPCPPGSGSITSAAFLFRSRSAAQLALLR